MRRKEYRVVWYRSRPKYGYDGKRIGEHPPERHVRKFAQKRYAERLAMILAGRGGEWYVAQNGGRDGRNDMDYPGQQPWWCKEEKGHCETIPEHHEKLASRFDPLVGEPVIEERWAEYGPWESAAERSSAT